MNAQSSQSVCDGAGKCVPGATTDCPGNFQCDPATSKCRTMCAVDADCTQNHVCAMDHTCAAPTVGVPTCVDDHTTRAADGHTIALCDPFTCDKGTGACRPTCAAVTDCVAPNVCDTAGACVAPPTQSSGDSGGCATTGARSGSGAWLVALVAIGALRRRRGRSLS
jgi:MYXO-CTERM domain-containing protein